MKHLSSEAQRLIAQTRNLDEPSLDDRVRVRTRLDASWSTSPLARDTGATGLGGKLWLTGLSISVLAGIGIWLASTPARQPLAMNRAPLVQPSAATTPPTAAQLPGLNTHELATGVASRSIPVARAQPISELDEPRVAAGPPRRARAKSRELDARAAQASADAAPLPAAASTQSKAPAAPLRATTSPQPAGADAAPLRATESLQPKAASDHLAAEPSSAAQSHGQAAQVQTRQSRRPRVSAPVSVEAVDESAEAFVPDPIADEVSLLGAAQEALREGQPTRAMNYIRQHAFRFPTGALAQERSAVHALALCALDRKSAARQVFADLQRRAPSAAVLARIRQDCGFD